jgi:hypothetical protein
MILAFDVAFNSPFVGKVAEAINLFQVQAIDLLIPFEGCFTNSLMKFRAGRFVLNDFIQDRFAVESR